MKQQLERIVRNSVAGVMFHFAAACVDKEPSEILHATYQLPDSLVPVTVEVYKNRLGGLLS